MIRVAAARSTLLSLLFLAVYGGCNWLASQRADVGVWFFAWERHIPFWPAMIVPYLSIDLFFVAAPFLCRDRAELDVFTRRTIAAIAVAGLCFVAWPLRFAFERPVVDGFLGGLFNGFTALDRPFNLVPSLHVTLAVIVGAVYRRHTRGITRLAVTAWFVLIALSTVFTYQHHVVDVIGGLVLAAGVFIFIGAPHGTLRKAFAETRNPKVATYYVLTAAILIATALLVQTWAWLLLWPALSLAIVSAAYGGLGPRVFRKSQGRLPLSTWILMWPYLIGQRASLAWYSRQCRAFDAITPTLWIGRRLTDREAAAAVTAGVSAVIDLTADFTESPVLTRLPYLNLQVLDLTGPADDVLDRATQFIAHHSRRGVVFVHCKIGYSRSAAMVAASLIASGQVQTADEAFALIRRFRPQVVIRPEIVARFTARTARPVVGVSLLDQVVAHILGITARALCGRPLSGAQRADDRPRVYFANHTSHLDFIALWGSLPLAVRVRTRPVAGRDYWDAGPLRRIVARRLLRAILVDRAASGLDRHTTERLAQRSVERAARALDDGESLIIFPEGTRGSGVEVGAFKSGLYHLCRLRPDVELIPVRLSNMHRILPRGATIPLPLSGAITFGAPLRLRSGEAKDAFLTRARASLIEVGQPCTSSPTTISRAS